jgi:hypothetical protein
MKEFVKSGFFFAQMHIFPTLVVQRVFHPPFTLANDPMQIVHPHGHFFEIKLPDVNHALLLKETMTATLGLDANYEHLSCEIGANHRYLNIHLNARGDFF